MTQKDKVAFQSKADHPQTTHTDTQFSSCDLDLDLDLDSMTLTYELDLDILKMCLLTEMKFLG